jgi:hypothetical protein
LTPAYFRERVAQLRDIAGDTPPGPDRDELLRLADEYEQLAERLEAASAP